MPTALVDLRRLAAAVDLHRPSGDDLAYTDGYAEMERLARGRCEQQFGRAIYEAQEPHWKSLEEHARALAARTHDLRVGVYLTQGLLRTQGIAGLADGLELLRSWLTNEWDTLHPALDPDDGNEAVERSNILLELCDRERTLAGIMRAPLASCTEIGTCALADIRTVRGERPAEGTKSHLSLSEIQAIFTAADRAALERLRRDAERAERSLMQIRQVFQLRTGVFPNLEPVTAMLQEIRGVLEEFLPGQAAPETKAPPAAASSSSVPASAAASITPERLHVAGRRDVVAILNALCDYYNRNEPSSPVPLLLHRARRLVDMDFLDIVRNLAPDGLADVSRWAGGLDACDKN
ncbi:MAG: type VI secretion system protein TssA [Planctomycetaceae bacterium]